MGTLTVLSTLQMSKTRFWSWQRDNSACTRAKMSKSICSARVGRSLRIARVLSLQKCLTVMYVYFHSPHVTQKSSREFLLMNKARPRRRIKISRTCTTKSMTSSGLRQSTVRTGVYLMRTHASRMRSGRKLCPVALEVVSRRFYMQLDYEL